MPDTETAAPEARPPNSTWPGVLFLMTLSTVFGVGIKTAADWWMAPETTTTIVFESTSTTLVSPELKSAPVKDLAVSVSGVPVDRLHLHAFALRHGGGPQADAVRIYADVPGHILGISSNDPSAGTEARCKPQTDSVDCVLSTIRSDIGEYSLSIATDDPRTPTLTTTTRDVQLQRGTEVGSRATPTFKEAEVIFMFMGLMTSMLGLLIVMLLDIRSNPEHARFVTRAFRIGLLGRPDPPRPPNDDH